MKIYNSLTRKKEEFVPLKKNKVGMYVCGPTVYDEPHIGHARSAYIFDVIRRYLEYKKFKVTFVRNVTDVDDKIIAKAKEVTKLQSNKVTGLEESVKEVSKKYLAAYHEDMTLLGIAKPDKEPKATEYIPKMVKFIQLLIKKGCAYESEGDVYFDIKKGKDYGKLSNQNLEKMEIGARILPGEKKRDGLDFALWKKAKEGEPSWDSPWGKGRPGWHIECSVMSSDILGDEFDIHGGGIDLIFPHHENEMTQSEGAGKKFARFWMHNGLLTINNEKMAKSLGNFISIKDFISKYKDADLLKLLFLNTHYRHPVDYTDEKINEMRSQKERITILVEKMERILKDRRSKDKNEKLDKDLENLRIKFEKAMDDDFNMPEGVAAMFEIVSEVNKNMDDPIFISGARKILLDIAAIFGIGFTQRIEDKEVLSEIKKMIEKRNRARGEGDFTEADKIRKKLLDKGIILEDTKEGTVWRRKV